MNELLRAIILGIVQGITEFLPISSSGHLRLGHELLSFNLESNFAFDVVVHFATLLATVIVFRKEVLAVVTGFFKELRPSLFREFATVYKTKRDFRIAILIVVGLIPLVLVGLPLKKLIDDAPAPTTETLTTESNREGVATATEGEGADASAPIRIPTSAVPVFLIINGGILLATYFAQKRAQANGKEKDALSLGVLFALLVGLAQAIAVIPGISRSGSTIATAVFMGTSRAFAGVYSFLLSLPAITGAMLLEAKNIAGLGNYGVLIAGFVSAFVSGYFALKVLLSFLKKGKLYFFSFYCFLAGISGIAYFVSRG